MAHSDGKRRGIVIKKFGRQPLTFGEKVVLIARSIPQGKVMTYGGIARAAGGGRMASQSITAILGRAYDRGTKDIPFHRIVYANGKVWLTDEYRSRRLHLYKKEGITLTENGYIQDFDEHLYDPQESA